jgi:hypothetical protein
VAKEAPSPAASASTMTDSDVARVAAGRLHQVFDALEEDDPRLEIIVRVARRFEAEATSCSAAVSGLAENLLLGRTRDTCAFIRRTSRAKDRRLVLVAEWCGGMAGGELPSERTCGAWREGKPTCTGVRPAASLRDP